MAGDWIKVEENMPDKPEVWQIANTLGMDGDTIAGKLLRVSAWASRNCNADGVTNVTVLPLLDRCTGVAGFAAAMVNAGWLKVEGQSVSFPNFDRHCSQTAKDRAHANRRMARLREKRDAGTVTNVTPAPSPKPSPEKRREEYNTPIPAGDKAPDADKAPKPKGPMQLRAEALMHRKPTTPLTQREARLHLRPSTAPIGFPDSQADRIG